MAVLPDPVAITARTSRPPTTASTASRCPGRSDGKPSRSEASLATFTGRPYPALVSSKKMATTSEGRRTRLAEQRKKLPDGPGVYLFHDAKGKVSYVGKAKSIRKRVASHFSNPVTRGAYEMVDEIESVDFLLVSSEAEALLA